MTSASHPDILASALIEVMEGSYPVKSEDPLRHFPAASSLCEALMVQYPDLRHVEKNGVELTGLHQGIVWASVACKVVVHECEALTQLGPLVVCNGVLFISNAFVEHKFLLRGDSSSLGYLLSQAAEEAAAQALGMPPRRIPRAEVADIEKAVAQHPEYQSLVECIPSAERATKTFAWCFTQSSIHADTSLQSFYEHAALLAQPDILPDLGLLPLFAPLLNKNLPDQELLVQLEDAIGRLEPSSWPLALIQDRMFSDALKQRLGVLDDKITPEITQWTRKIEKAHPKAASLMASCRAPKTKLSIEDHRVCAIVVEEARMHATCAKGINEVALKYIFPAADKFSPYLKNAQPLILAVEKCIKTLPSSTMQLLYNAARLFPFAVPTLWEKLEEDVSNPHEAARLTLQNTSHWPGARKFLQESDFLDRLLKSKAAQDPGGGLPAGVLTLIVENFCRYPKLAADLVDRHMGENLREMRGVVQALDITYSAPQLEQFLQRFMEKQKSHPQSGWIDLFINTLSTWPDDEFAERVAGTLAEHRAQVLGRGTPAVPPMANRRRM